jgi:hypothetical protein
MILTSLRRRKHDQSTRPEPAKDGKTPGAGIEKPVAAENRAEPDFINLSSRPAKRTDSAKSNDEEPSAAAGHVQERLEVIRLAREMLAARQSPEEIARCLPVSQAELAMLDRN